MNGNGFCPMYDRDKHRHTRRGNRASLSVEDRVVDVILCLNLDYNLDKDKVNKEANFNDLGMNSLDKLDLITEIEKEFDIQIPISTWINMRNVGDLIKLVDIELSRN